MGKTLNGIIAGAIVAGVTYPVLSLISSIPGTIVGGLVAAGTKRGAAVGAFITVISPLILLISVLMTEHEGNLAAIATAFALILLITSSIAFIIPNMILGAIFGFIGSKIFGRKKEEPVVTPAMPYSTAPVVSTQGGTATPSKDTVTCPNCGSLIPSYSTFYPICGAKLK
ncbi:MAG: hypothetical protein DRO67_07830 [Candidatus Asgardarchaeum californiense]|nr:MAG: hypothetical protein DRO67_07830 [Candidatus Asgardarchaeum californiense]